MAADNEPVAFLGIGTMGHAMATRALGAGIPTIVWNRSAEAMRDLGELGAHVAESGADAAGRAAIVVTMVTDVDAVLEIAKAMLPGMAPGAIWVQMSTIGDRGTQRVESLVRAERSDVILVDAPVSGSKGPAEQGLLTIFASGPEAVRSRLDPLFDALGRRTIWVGPVGTGSRLKLVANTWLALAAEALNVSVAFAHQLGLETESVASALGDGPLVSPWQADKLERIARGDFSVQFALSLALKDVHLALGDAGHGRFETLVALAEEWEEVVGLGFGEDDLTIVARVLEQQGGRG
jgi:3-hydroxyisobutyrate dehydrogenase